MRLVLPVLIALASAPVAHAQIGQVRSSSPHELGFSRERLARIGAVLGAEIEHHRIPGAVVLVARKGRIAYFESFGVQDPATGKKMSRDAIFRAYSMTKPWVAVATMILVEEGRIQLTDPVSKYLPSFKDLKVAVQQKDPATGQVTTTVVPAEREPTIHDLLRHTSGIAYDFLTQNVAVREAYAKEKLSPEDPGFVEKLARAPLAFQPGGAWEYSFATDLLGRLIEAVTNVRLSAFLEERIFRPLQMTDSGFWVPNEKLGRVAQPFAKDPATGEEIDLGDPAVEPKSDSGGGGGLTTAVDYFRFAQMMLDGGELEGKRIIGPGTVALMTSDHLGAIPPSFISPGGLLMGVEGYTVGLGFGIRQGPGIAGVPGSAGEYMWAGAAGTFFWIDPKEQLVAVFMTQAPGPTRRSYRRLIKQLVGQALVEAASAPTSTGARRAEPVRRTLRGSP